jgi:arylsulfatase A-like enzyme
MFGKWHLGYTPERHPLSRGFDEFFGFAHGAHPYLKVNDNFGLPVMRGREPVTEVDYLTDAFAREAVAFIERNKDVPFFTYLPFNAVHGPLESIQKYLDRFKHISDAKRRTFAAMLSAMDDGIGSVMSKVRELGLEKDTLFVFISDNGGPTQQTSSSNTPLRGFKGQVLEGGIRIPYVMRWKGHIPEGQVRHDPVISLDIAPTVLAAVGSEISPTAGLDGVNLMPWLTQNAPAPHDRLFWRFGNQAAARIGDWKILKTKNDEQWQLFDLKNDISETKDLAGANPDKVGELSRLYDAWNSLNIAPLWETANEKTPKRNKKRLAKKEITGGKK